MLCELKFEINIVKNYTSEKDIQYQMLEKIIYYPKSPKNNPPWEPINVLYLSLVQECPLALTETWNW
jgi:hypothetical protein